MEREPKPQRDPQGEQQSWNIWMKGVGTGFEAAPETVPKAKYISLSEFTVKMRKNAESDKHCSPDIRGEYAFWENR